MARRPLTIPKKLAPCGQDVRQTPFLNVKKCSRSRHSVTARCCLECLIIVLEHQRAIACSAAQEQVN
eukprot:365431-Chlamydomonas_euryale.AAC.33